MQQKHLDYLDKLRESGITNMYGAKPYLQKTFPMSKNMADKILKYWMDNFDEKGTKVN